MKVLKNDPKAIRPRKGGMLTMVEGIHAKVGAGRTGYRNTSPFSRVGKPFSGATCLEEVTLMRYLLGLKTGSVAHRMFDFFDGPILCRFRRLRPNERPGRQNPASLLRLSYGPA